MDKKKEASPKIVFQDNQLIIVDKPCGLTVNRSETAKDGSTLQDWIENKFEIKNSPRGEAGQKFKITGESDFYKRSGIVHRLDKDTSGLLIIAKNPLAFSKLLLQFKSRLVVKTYLAIVWGKLTGQGEINAPITRNPFNRKKFGVFSGGKEAHTNYQAITTAVIYQEELTLCYAFPLTGRTHQIRIHLNYTGHPIVGDVLYSGRTKGRWGLTHFKRMMLHALKISFLDPQSGERRDYQSEIPEEFKQPAWKQAI